MFTICVVGVLGAGFHVLNEVKQVHVSHRLSLRLRRIRVGVYG